jgi:hypothetical protein
MIKIESKGVKLNQAGETAECREASGVKLERILY